MNKCKPTPGGYKLGQRRKVEELDDRKKPDTEEYQVHLGSNPHTGIRLPSHDGPEYGPVTVMDGSGATIRVIEVAELEKRGMMSQGARPVLVGHERWIDSDSIIKRL